MPHNTDDSVIRPLVMGAINSIEPKTILEVGATGSTTIPTVIERYREIRIIGVDPRPNPFRAITTIEVPLLDLPEDEKYDLVLLLNTLPFVGTGAYGLEKGKKNDHLETLLHAIELVKRDGTLILTTPVGDPKVTQHPAGPIRVLGPDDVTQIEALNPVGSFHYRKNEKNYYRVPSAADLAGCQYFYTYPEGISLFLFKNNAHQPHLTIEEFLAAKPTKGRAKPEPDQEIRGERRIREQLERAKSEGNT